MRSQLLEYLWTISSIVASIIQITSILLLARERLGAVWLMFSGALVGAVINLAGQLGFSRYFLPNQNSWMYLQTASWLGWMCFTLGLLWFALKRRALANRVEELEAILRAHSDHQAANRTSDPPA